MKILITAGPTREYLDTVRFISNASSGRMGYAIAKRALRAGHEVTLLVGPISIDPPAGCEVVPFVSVSQLKDELHKRFDFCDVLVMAAAVGDFRPKKVHPTKLARSAGPITITLIPTKDVLAGIAANKRPGQIVVSFAVEDGPQDEIETKARTELIKKHADYVVVNTPDAMAADKSRACILSADAVILPWDQRPKDKLAKEIIRILEERG